MRKIAIMLGVAMLLVIAAAGVAIAAERFNEKNCGDNALPCKGTDRDDLT
jgi:hypothetical protein